MRSALYLNSLLDLAHLLQARLVGLVKLSAIKGRSFGCFHTRAQILKHTRTLTFLTFQQISQFTIALSFSLVGLVLKWLLGRHV